MVIAFIDDYRNIHTNHRPSSESQTNVATLLVKSFTNVKAIDSAGPDDQDQKPANSALLQFFDPESQWSRLLAHNYQKDDIMKMRSIENCKLVDVLNCH